MPVVLKDEVSLHCSGCTSSSLVSASEVLGPTAPVYHTQLQLCNRRGCWSTIVSYSCVIGEDVGAQKVYFSGLGLHSRWVETSGFELRQFSSKLAMLAAVMYKGTPSKERHF